MKLRTLFTHQSLITHVCAEVIDLAAFLDIPTDIVETDDHIFIRKNSSDLGLSSFFVRRESDVYVSAQVFCEILLDIKAGSTVLDAFNKQGYTFNIPNLKE